ncbi:MAG: hypothetical protein NTX92_08945 [Euryarchaeota archaeon]|nr:hypothetical protein [Euryarchaeota archaeon]
MKGIPHTSVFSHRAWQGNSRLMAQLRPFLVVIIFHKICENQYHFEA